MNSKEKTDSKKLILCDNVKYLMEKHRLSRTKMMRIMGVCMKTLRSIENDFVPPQMSCRVLYNLYQHFHICSYELLTVKLRERDKENEQK
ncbi:MAG: hypothetical protein J6D11_03645 [Clostridia bacterium]|nr:hypothetical protein [Clostridia bacterium]